jgi:alkylation response protein AidB-like acyl-CoA dehydrogenase
MSSASDTMDVLPEPQLSEAEIVALVDNLMAGYGPDYWRALDRERAYPTEFVRAMTQAGLLSVLIPAAYGGGGQGIAVAAEILKQVHRLGGNAAACHAQMYTMGTLVRHGGGEQKARWLPQIASGALRLQAFAVTEPSAGTDTSSIRTFARREGDHYVVNGQKVWTSRAEHSDLMLLLARTSPVPEGGKRTDGMSMFLVDMRDTVGRGLTIRPIRTLMNHATTEIFFDDLVVPAENRIGEEGRGFRYLLDGLNAERILIAAECVGDGRWFVDKAVGYAKAREVFGRPIGQNQGVQFPIARAHIAVESAELMLQRACTLYDADQVCGAEANMAKLQASEASWAAADTCVQTHGGYGFAEEYDVERKFRETRLYQVAPISTNLILSYVGEHVLGLPRSF